KIHGNTVYEVKTEFVHFSQHSLNSVREAFCNFFKQSSVINLQTNVSLNIAITGESGAGKSTFINAFRGIGDEDDGAAPTDFAESSKDPIPYFHPDYPNVSLWDLPGIGTPKYPADKYLRSVPFKKYDFYIIISADHLTENDVKLAKEIQRMMKKFYFVHSKTDNDINVGKKKDFTAEGTLSKIRKNCIESPQVFLVSSFEPRLYDFPLLRKTLERELDVQRDALLVRSSAIREGLRVEQLLLHIERSQLRWFGHLTRMPPGHLLGEVFQACPTGRRSRGRPRTRWRDYISRLAWERLGVPPDKLEEVAGEREVWASLLRLLPPRPGLG
uniref:IRG-type G domain-containing protein n=1 Tax=Maylandia zebra TaxID=106582 RepID=A0A3P9DSK2_9CICH